ncbi:MAG: hypothetical protein F4175_14680 [Gemmatimonadetes bacterium]|nr:hypothetical protein [Gemmatimonadota bacterium]
MANAQPLALVQVFPLRQIQAKTALRQRESLPQIDALASKPRPDCPAHRQSRQSYPSEDQ